MRAGYSGVIEASPNPQTRTFAGHPINMSALARTTGCSPSHLSRIFKGMSCPSLPLAKALAISLSVSVDEFVAHLDGLRDKVRASKGATTVSDSA